MKSLLPLLLCLSLYLPVWAQETGKPQNRKASENQSPYTSRYDDLLLNQIQVIGSHNSYKQAIDAPLLEYLKQTNGALADGLAYSHIPIPDQLSMGLANLEIDVYNDANGGKYAQPKGLEWATKGDRPAPYDPEGLMREPGFKVFHIQEVDFRSNCLTLKNCLQEMKSWSEGHPGHQPVFVTINAKDQPIDKPGFAVPEKFTAAVFDQLDQAIREYLGPERLLTPDQVRGNYQTLESAVLNGSWPKVKAAKGKFIFILDETGQKLDAYTQNHPSLSGRTLFVNAQPGNPQAAILVMNDPVQDLTKIQELVKRGYIVRTRADANTKEARRNDKSTFKAACRSGAQIITTDYYQPSRHFKSAYKISFADGSFFRENPLLQGKAKRH